MDNSVSKVLIIVASVLLAMLVIAFLTFSFNKMGEWASANEEEILIEQKDKFNKEYEVYDKDLMYGVDVISCLNKAKSNNDKIQGKYAEAVDESYEVKVSLTINSALTEGIRIYHMNDDIKEVEYTNSNPQKDKKRINEIFNISTQYINSGISRLPLNRELKYGYEETRVTEGTYKLTAKSSTTSQYIDELLMISNEVKQTVKNDSPTAVEKDSWTKAVWETPLYDLKTRKFKCTKLEYSPDTGRINNIEFKEI